MADIRAKDVNFSIPLYMAPVNTAEQERASYGAGGGGLEQALSDWLESSRKVRGALATLLVEGSKTR